jgi:hypothetical protein
MPKLYETIRDKCIKNGGSSKACKTKAAKIYQSIRKKHPSMPKLSNKKNAK